MLSAVKQYLKNFIKKYFYIILLRDKFTPALQVNQRQLFLYYQQCFRENKIIRLSDTGYKVFSQHEEDGLLLFIFAIIGTTAKTFVDIGGNDGVNSNCANFAVNFGWHGLFIDSDKTAVKRGIHFYKRYPDPWSFKPRFVCQKVTRENINPIIEKEGFSGSIDLLSIDIDGNDYWIWDAINILEPRVVMVEAKVEFGFNNVVVPYDPGYSHLTKNPLYNGASPVAFNNLAKRKGYRLAGANGYGHNMIFIKNGLADDYFPEVAVATILTHPSAIESFKDFERVMHLEFIEG
ncbi:MAG: hypothetical protein H7Z13_16340 [Ferruginibacter sp.]|nr:hypothetical protein [Ferruginibacter sp.]